MVALQNWQVRYSQPGTVLKSIPRGDVATDPDPVCPLGRPRAARVGDELAALGAAFGGVELQEKRSGKPMRAAKLA